MGTPITTNITQSTFGDNATITGSVTNILSSDLLPTAGDATYDSFAEQHNPTCLTNTRTELLHQIQQWVVSPTSESIFWLNGMAGTGKSTIARTIAKWLRETEARNVEDGSTRLSASFFFKEGKGDRGHARLFFTTIASQLVTLKSKGGRELRSLIAEAINEDPGIKHKALAEQFDKLIKQPLRDVQKPMTITMVVDAMDECDEFDDAKLIVGLLPQLSKIPSLTVRAFLTSRPELPIRLGFEDHTCKYQEMGLHEISHFVIEQDLTTFFIHALGKIRDKQNQERHCDNQVPLGWPGPENIRLLVGMASPLFIFASTVCRFIDKSPSPEKKLLKILEYQHAMPLEAVYAPILNQLLSDVAEEDQLGVVKGFKEVVGSLVSLQEPLSANSLSTLLGVPRPDIDQILRQFHSVLVVPSDPDAPIEVLHKSFSDFLLSTGKTRQISHRFWVDSGESHERIACGCLKVLENSLTEILTQLRSPRPSSKYTTNELHDLFPLHLRYAFRYWIYHLNHANSTLRIKEQVEFFLQNHFLQWVETLILIGKPWAIPMKYTLESLVSKYGDPKLLLKDAKQYILAYRKARKNCHPGGDYSALNEAIWWSSVVLEPQSVNSILDTIFWNHKFST